jgi:hypothetical protein
MLYSEGARTEPGAAGSSVAPLWYMHGVNAWQCDEESKMPASLNKKDRPKAVSVFVI